MRSITNYGVLLSPDKCRPTDLVELRNGVKPLVDLDGKEVPNFGIVVAYDIATEVISFQPGCLSEDQTRFIAQGSCRQLRNSAALIATMLNEYPRYNASTGLYEKQYFPRDKESDPFLSTCLIPQGTVTPMYQSV